MLGDDFKSISVLYRRIMFLTVVTWSIYPIIFIFGPNGSVISGTSGIAEVTVVLDMLSKGLSGVMFSFAKRSLNKAQDKLAGAGDEEEEDTTCFGMCHNQKKKAPHAAAAGGLDQAQMFAMIQAVLAQQMQAQAQAQMQLQMQLGGGSGGDATIEMQPQVLTPRTATAAVMQHMNTGAQY